ncbi:IclR family transcriptional regulator [Anaerococcus sp. WCA-380-WT-2B]|uniref:IclR family transcriptional regulator n=1 Tax=Anaerococcus porci TaxID=2652269 RepID=A0A6N7VX43_9FIRM|nr:IclR family transcriptional regulator [Anaerococcus porci]MSS78437.1 IclR family transcriptional regulator [Anaerococcus porci]
MEYKLHNPTLRVVKILDLINNFENGLSFLDISTKLEIPKSTLSPILKTLEITNFIEKNDKGCYVASFKLFQLGLSYSGRLDCLSMIRKQMEIVVDKIGEIVQFGVLIDDMVLYLEKVNAPDNIEIVSSVGKKIPAIYTGLGKALLSGFSDEEIIEKFKDYEFVRYTENSITNIDRLLDEIHMVREKGYAVENQEFTLNTSCVAVPIREDGIIKGAMSATYPNFRKTENTENFISKVLLEQKEIIEDIIKIQNLKLDFTNSEQ